MDRLHPARQWRGHPALSGHRSGGSRCCQKPEAERCGDQNLSHCIGFLSRRPWLANVLCQRWFHVAAAAAKTSSRGQIVAVLDEEEFINRGVACFGK
jgi:hypothetical protein